MTGGYKSDGMAAVHETATDLHEIGLLDQRTMKEFDQLCLAPVELLSPDDIRELRLSEQASQAVFARYLRVTTGVVSQWERGQKRPGGASLELLNIVARKGLQAVA